MPCWLIAAALAGLAGMALSLAPPGTLLPAACPASMRSLRQRAWHAVFGAGSGPAPDGLAPATFRGLDAASGLPLWAREDLRAHGACGADFAARGGRTLLGVAGNVYDVTEKGLAFYGPGAGYCLFAGHDATRSLALGSLKEEDLAMGGDVAGVPPADVLEQGRFYSEKYGPPVGKLLPQPPTALPTQAAAPEVSAPAAAAEPEAPAPEPAAEQSL